ncbi:hypothetical protein B8049_17965 [Klebsiella pneumoniae]|nr:hypothetical protein B8049_17965 [Klebsiella pneumoniae]
MLYVMGMELLDVFVQLTPNVDSTNTLLPTAVEATSPKSTGGTETEQVIGGSLMIIVSLELMVT